MVCVTITRNARRVNGDTVSRIRDALHEAVVEVMRVKPEDVELRIRETSRLDINSGVLTIEIDTGPGKDGWRLAEGREIILKINEFLIKRDVVPKDLQRKGKSNMWLRVYAKGASLPIGCPDKIH